MNALAGMRVIDLTNAIAGSSAAKLLTDLGAEVIKVESPTGGDFTRGLMPFIYQAHNRNKRSLAMDLRTREGIALMHRLVQTADVFVQSLRPGAAARLGLDRERLTRMNPRLVYASFSAFNPRGPGAERRGVDAVAQAESGMVAMQGGLLGNLGYIDTTAGLALSHAILAALIKRERTGEADSVEVNLLDTALYMQSAPLAEYSVTAEVPDQANYLARFPVVGLFQASDGLLQIAGYYEQDWKALCETLGQPELLEDSRFGDAAQRRHHAADLNSLLAPAFSRAPRRHWVEQLSARGILCGEVRDYAEVLADMTVGANPPDRIAIAPDRIASCVRAPFSFNAELLASTRPAPTLGADTAAVLRAMDLSELEIADLARRGIIATNAEIQPSQPELT